MLRHKKIRIDKDLWVKISHLSEAAGYSSPDEFIMHALEKQIAEFDAAETDEEIRKKLKGLGYIS